MTEVCKNTTPAAADTPCGLTQMRFYIHPSSLPGYPFRGLARNWSSLSWLLSGEGGVHRRQVTSLISKFRQNK